MKICRDEINFSYLTPGVSTKLPMFELDWTRRAREMKESFLRLLEPMPGGQFASILAGAFDWGYTRQGSMFWQKIYTDCYQDGYTPYKASGWLRAQLLVWLDGLDQLEKWHVSGRGYPIHDMIRSYRL